MAKFMEEDIRRSDVKKRIAQALRSSINGSQQLIGQISLGALEYVRQVEWAGADLLEPLL